MSVTPFSAKLIIILSPNGENLGAKVIPGNEPNNSCSPVSKLKIYTLGSFLKYAKYVIYCVVGENLGVKTKKLPSVKY